MNQRIKKGFTIIELMLAMGFVSVLLIAIAFTTIQISNIYNKGLTLRSVNQAGRELISVFKKDINSSMPFSVEGDDTQFIEQKTGGYTYGGRLCLGNISYVWNYGPTLADNGANEYNKYNDNDGSKVRLARVIDNGGQLCVGGSQNVIDESKSTELLKSKDNLDLALHDFDIKRANSGSTKTSQALYAIEFIIGTNQQEAITTELTCVPPSGSSNESEEENWEFCAVNVFDIVVRAANNIATEGSQ